MTKLLSTIDLGSGKSLADIMWIPDWFLHMYVILIVLSGMV